MSEERQRNGAKPPTMTGEVAELTWEESTLSEKLLRRGLLLAVLVLLVVLRMYGLDEQGTTADEYTAAVLARDATLAEYGPINAYRIPDNLPVYFTVLYYWEHLVGPAARELSVLFSLLTGIVIYRLAARVFSPAAGILAVLFFALSPFNIFHGQSIRPYALYTFFGVASISCVERLINEGPKKRHLLASMAINLLMVYTHLIGGVLLAVEGLALLWCWRRKLPMLVVWAVPQLLLLLPILTLLQIPESDPTYPAMTLWQTLLNTFHTDSPIYSVELITSRDNWGFTVMGYDRYRLASYAATLFMALLSLAAIWLAATRRSRAIAFLLFAMLMPGLLLYVASMLLEPISLPRYMLFVNGARYVLAAGVLFALPFAWLRWGAAAVLTGLLCVQLSGMLPYGARPESARIGKLIREQATPQDFVVTAMYPDALYVHFPLAGDLDLLAVDLMAYDFRAELPILPEHSVKGIVQTVARELGADDRANANAWIVLMRLYDSSPVPAMETALKQCGLEYEYRPYYAYNGFSVYRAWRPEGRTLTPPPLRPDYDVTTLLDSWGIPLPSDAQLSEVEKDFALLLDDPQKTLDVASNYVALGFILAHRNPAMAESALRKGLERFPENGGLHLALGVVLLLLDRQEDARTAFDTCRPLLSTGTAPIFEPVADAAASGDFATARDRFKRAQELSGNMLYDVIGDALERAVSAAP
jgi:hypothetical protein